MEARMRTQEVSHINRTIEELKQQKLWAGEVESNHINRTIEELKPSSSVRLDCCEVVY